MKLTVIGGGNMGLTFAKGIHNSGLLNDQISILEKSTDNLVRLQNQEKDFIISNIAKDCIGDAELIILAVKPFHSEEVYSEIKPYINEGQLIISLMAGVKIETIQKGLGISKVVRTMPNLPAMIGKGMTGFTKSAEVSQDELVLIKKILSSTGKAIEVSNEEEIDKITGLSGSGSAYVFYFMESLMNAAKDMGFKDDEAKTIITQTFEGAVELYKQNNDSTSEWINKVCSKGGTTIAAIDSFENNKVKKHIAQGAEAAYKRAVELGKA